jgi:exopolyphosphatase/guanosine-5'-triphosphate,3'-diphosphate pyrophosphatase
MKEYGVIDIGSNTIRIVIFKMNSGRGLNYKVLENTKESTRLRNYVVNNELSNVGIQKMLRVLHDYIEMSQLYNLEELHIFATQTIRMVDNQSDILDIVKQELGVDIHVLSKEEEALLGFQGMHTYLPNATNGIYVDLGGGSMELVYFENGIPIHNISLDFGSVVLRSMIGHAVPNQTDITFLKGFLLEQFNQVPWLKQVKGPLVVVGGSARNLCRIDRFITKRVEYTHGYQIGFREIKRTRKLLMLLTLEEIENIEGLTPSRADIIVPSIYAFETLYNYIKAPHFTCSRTGLREGVLLELLGAVR